MKTFIIVPNWNGEDFIVECLQSLQQQAVTPRIVVVENGSVDRSVDIIETKFPDVILLKQPRNLGFAGGVNVGIRHALENGAEAIALFNNDAIADKNWLKNLLENMQSSEKIGVVTGKFMRIDRDHVDSAGEQYSVWGMPFPRGRNQEDKGQYDQPVMVFGATGGASLYRVDMLREIGLFDEVFFAYYEDVDISFRAQLAGWKVAYEPSALAYHHVSGTSSKLGSFTRYHATKNFYLLYAKNMPGWLYWRFLPLFTLQSLRLATSSTIKGGLWPFVKGSAKAFWLTPHIMKERRNIQKSRTVSLGYINSILYKHRPPRIPETEE